MIDAAKAWFTQPWKIAGGSKTLWFVRYEAVREAEIKRQHKLEADRDKK